MSHRVCSKHSTLVSQDIQQKPQRQQQNPDYSSCQVQVQFTSPAKKRVQSTPYTQSTGVSPNLQGRQEAQIKYQSQGPTSHFQNFTSQNGNTLKPQEVDQQKLRQEIEEREHELKLLAQMDYLIDLIKSLDQDRNINIDSAIIQEIQDYKTNVEEEIINQSFNQNSGRGEIPKEQGVQGYQSNSQNLGGLHGCKERVTINCTLNSRSDEKDTVISELNGEIDRLQNELSQVKGELEYNKNLFNKESNQKLIQNFEKLLNEQRSKENDFILQNSEQQLKLEQLSEQILELIAKAKIYEETISNKDIKIESLEKDISQNKKDLSQNQILINQNQKEMAEQEQQIAQLQKLDEELQLKNVTQEGIILNLKAQLEETISKLSKIQAELEESKSKNQETENEKEESLKLIRDIRNECQDIKNQSLAFQKEIEESILREELARIETSQFKALAQQNADKFGQITSENYNLKEIIQQLTAKIQESAQQNDQLQRELNDARSQISSLEKALQESQPTQQEIELIASLTSKVEELSITREQEKHRRIAAETCNEEQRHQIEYLNNDIQQLRQKFIEIEMKKENLVIENNELRLNFEELREEQIKVKEEYAKHMNKLQNELSDQFLKIQQLTQERDSSKKELEDLSQGISQEKENLKKQFEELQSEIQLVTQERDSLKREFEDLQKSLCHLEQALVSIQGSGRQSGDDELQSSTKRVTWQEAEGSVEGDTPKSHSQQLPYHEQLEILASNNDLILSQNDLAQSIHSAKLNSSIHESQKLKESQGSKLSQQQNFEQQQVVDDCLDCEACMLEAALIQNEHLKEQLLVKEKEIIELKTNPTYYSRAINYGKVSNPSLLRSPYNNGKGASFIETNDQIVNTRVQGPQQLVTSSPNPLRQQAAKSKQQLSGSKLQNSPNLTSSTEKQQKYQQDYQPKNQSYSRLESEIDQLQRLFNDKCKEVDSWKRVYSKFDDGDDN